MVSDILKEVPIFSKLDADELERVVELATVRDYSAGATLFSRGDPPNAFHVVARGRIEIRIPAEEGGEERTVTLGQGKFFGEMGVIRGTPRMADAVVAEDVELVSIEADDFDQLMSIDEKVSEKVMAAYLERVKELEEAKKEAGQDHSSDEPRTMLFLSPGAGSGASFLCANLAVKIRDLTQKTVLVLDLDLQGPTQHLYLGYDKPVGGLRAVFNAPQITSSAVKGAARRLPWEVELLGGPGVPDVEEVSPDRLRELVRAASKAYDYVLVDGTSAISPLNDALVRACDATHVVIGNDKVTLTRVEPMLKHLEEEGFRDKVRLVLNKQRPRHGLDPSAIEETFQRTVLGRVEYADSLVMDALGEGAPVAKHSPRSMVAVQLSKLARQLLSLPSSMIEDLRTFSIWNLFS